MNKYSAIIIILFLFSVFPCHLFANLEKQNDNEGVGDNKTSTEYTIGSGDVIGINVYEEPDLCKVVRVSEAGTITYPLIGRINVAGLTIVQIEEKLIELLAADYLVNPQVDVFIQEYSKFYVYGEVKEVGAYPLYGKLSVLEAITMAGGFTKVAAKNRVRIKRMESGAEKIIEVNVNEITSNTDSKEDVNIKPNDVIIVNESFF